MDDEGFRQLVATTARNKDSHYYYTAELDARVVSASLSDRTAVIEFIAGTAEICSSNCLDEGLVGTIADYWTSTLITAVNGGRGAVTTTLSVQALRAVEPGTRIHVICTATEPDSRPMPYATARFVSAQDHGDVLALATHTKFFKR
ncbi:hypothetical protein GGF46_003534 [Coemansia sp. RSA 552]|nr:hypothetical protein GGF46_003534 [Coemansia sp. RSA 552]